MHLSAATRAAERAGYDDELFHRFRRRPTPLPAAQCVEGRCVRIIGEAR